MTEQRPWGFYTVVRESGSYKIKVIHVDPGHTLSLQYHHQRNEHWIVIEGEGQAEHGGQVMLLRRDLHLYIPAKVQHRLTNTGATPLVLAEVQIGDYLGEDDIVRLSDRYGRAHDAP